MTWKVNDGSLLRMHAWWVHTSHILLFPMLSSENRHKMPLTFFMSMHSLLLPLMLTFSIDYKLLKHLWTQHLSTLACAGWCFRSNADLSVTFIYVTVMKGTCSSLWVEQSAFLGQFTRSCYIFTVMFKHQVLEKTHCVTMYTRLLHAWMYMLRVE